MSSLQPLSAAVSTDDMDISITHIANTFEIGSSVLSLDRALPFALVFLGLTPFGMWARARFLARHGPYLTLPMNGLQRIVLYLAAYVLLDCHYRHLRYPASLHDKHGVASVLRDVFTRVREASVEELGPRFKLEGGEDNSEQL